MIRASIGADISDSLFGHKNNIVVEGYSDVIYLETMANVLEKLGKESINLDKVMIIGAGGAKKVPYLVSWFKAEKYNVLAMLDADDEGRDVAKKLKDNYGIDSKNEILTLDEISDEFKGKSLEIEDLFDEQFYNVAVNRAYKDIFEAKLGCPEIRLEEIESNGLKSKRYERFFKKNNLGNFDKIKVALEVKKMLLTDDKSIELLSDKTINNFEKLFAKIKEKFKNRGIDI